MERSDVDSSWILKMHTTHVSSTGLYLIVNMTTHGRIYALCEPHCVTINVWRMSPTDFFANFDVIIQCITHGSAIMNTNSDEPSMFVLYNNLKPSEYAYATVQKSIQTDQVVSLADTEFVDAITGLTMKQVVSNSS